MASPVLIQMILCDAAQAEQGTGKISMLGAGWSMTSSPTPAHAVAIMIKVPWDLANHKLPLKLRLLDQDGEPVRIQTDLGAQAIEISSELEVGRPAGLQRGAPIDAALALNFPSLPLPPGRYEYRLEVNADQASQPFSVQERRPGT